MGTKLNITKGEYKSRGGYSHKLKKAFVEVLVDDNVACTSYSKNEAVTDEMAYTALLICDAGNTYQSTGKLPSELAKENERLHKIANNLLVNLEARVQGVEHKDWLKTFFKEEIEFLENLKNKY